MYICNPSSPLSKTFLVRDSQNVFFEETKGKIF